MKQEVRYYKNMTGKRLDEILFELTKGYDGDMKKTIHSLQRVSTFKSVHTTKEASSPLEDRADYIVIYSELEDTE